jgi:hypothetical protein
MSAFITNLFPLIHGRNLFFKANHILDIGDSENSLAVILAFKSHTNAIL